MKKIVLTLFVLLLVPLAARACPAGFVTLAPTGVSVAGNFGVVGEFRAAPEFGISAFGFQAVPAFGFGFNRAVVGRQVVVAAPVVRERIVVRRRRW